MDDTLKILYIEVEQIPDLTDEVFTFSAPGETPLFFNATKLRAAIEADKSLARLDLNVHVDENIFRHLMQNNGIERAKLERLMQRPDIVCAPVLLAEMDNGKMVSVDGNHRTALRYIMGYDFVAAYIIPRSTWERHLIKFPPEMAEIFLR